MEDESIVWLWSGQVLRRCKIVKETRSPKGPAPSRLGIHLAEARDGDKKQARARVNHRVDVGLIPDPNNLPCSDCGHIYVHGERRHEHDHARGYSRAHQLYVEAVCTTCHHAREARR